MNRTPRSYEAGIALKTGTAPAHITDDEGKAVATRIPYLDVFDRSNDATELHDAPQKSCPARHQVMRLQTLCDERPIRNFGAENLLYRPCLRRLSSAFPLAKRDGDRVRLITRGGYRFPWIVEAALKNRQKRFVIDGRAAILGVHGLLPSDERA